MSKKQKPTGRLILEDDFDGDLEAYAEHSAGPVTNEIRNDPAHPWHRRKKNAAALIDQPDDQVASPEFENYYTRAEVCELLRISDSGFGKLGIPSRGKSGRYSLYSMGDVIYYRLARSYISGFRQAAGKPPDESIHQIAARIKAETQTEFGPPAPIYYPKNPGAAQ